MSGNLDLQAASDEREWSLVEEEIDRRLDLLLSNYQAVTANPNSMGHLRFLLKHYAKKAHPWKECYKDNFKRFGPKTAGLCAVLKDTIRQGTSWRGHPAADHGSPGVAIGEADAHRLSEPECDLDVAFMAEFPGVDEVPAEVFEIIFTLASKCNVTHVLLGLQQPPTIALEVAS